MKILHVGKYYPPVPGGMERVLQLLCEGERRQVDSRVLVTSTDGVTRREVCNGVPVTRAATIVTLGSVAVSPALAWELRRLPADVTVVHEPNPIALVADLVTRRRGALLVYFHSEVVRSKWKYNLFYRPFLDRVLRRADRILVASPPMAESDPLAAYRDKCVVVPYGIDLSRFEATPALEARAAAIRHDSPLPLALFVGRLVPYKGVDVLLRAMVDVPARLIIVGDGPLRESLQQLTATLGLAERVRFSGVLEDDELIAHYRAARVFVLPSVTQAEAFGMVQIEAMASGTPVISTNVPSGVPWVNRHGESGLVVPPGEVGPLTTAITAIVSDDALHRRLGTGARARVERDFSAQRMASRTVALYRQVLGEMAADGSQSASA